MVQQIIGSTKVLRALKRPKIIVNGKFKSLRESLAEALEKVDKNKQ